MNTIKSNTYIETLKTLLRIKMSQNKIKFPTCDTVYRWIPTSSIVKYTGKVYRSVLRDLHTLYEKDLIDTKVISGVRLWAPKELEGYNLDVDRHFTEIDYEPEVMSKVKDARLNKVGIPSIYFIINEKYKLSGHHNSIKDAWKDAAEFIKRINL